MTVQTTYKTFTTSSNVQPSREGKTFYCRLKQPCTPEKVAYVSGMILGTLVMGGGGIWAYCCGLNCDPSSSGFDKNSCDGCPANSLPISIVFMVVGVVGFVGCCLLNQRK